MKMRIPKSLAESLAAEDLSAQTLLFTAALEALRQADPGSRMAIMRRALPRMSEEGTMIEAPCSEELDALWRWFAAYARRACLRSDVLMIGALITALEQRPRPRGLGARPRLAISLALLLTVASAAYLFLRG